MQQTIKNSFIIQAILPFFACLLVHSTHASDRDRKRAHAQQESRGLLPQRIEDALDRVRDDLDISSIENLHNLDMLYPRSFKIILQEYLIARLMRTQGQRTEDLHNLKIVYRQEMRNAQDFLRQEEDDCRLLAADMQKQIKVSYSSPTAGKLLS